MTVSDILLLEGLCGRGPLCGLVGDTAVRSCGDAYPELELRAQSRRVIVQECVHSSLEVEAILYCVSTWTIALYKCPVRV